MGRFEKSPNVGRSTEVNGFLIEKGLINSEKDTEAFDEFTLVTLYVLTKKVEEWNSDSSNKNAELRWIQVFQYFRDNNLNHTIFCKIVTQACLLECTSRTNIFIDEQFMDGRKTQLHVSVLKAMSLTKVNFKMSCPKFYSFLKSSPDLLKQICLNEKYTSN